MPPPTLRNGESQSKSSANTNEDVTNECLKCASLAPFLARRRRSVKGSNNTLGSFLNDLIALQNLAKAWSKEGKYELALKACDTLCAEAEENDKENARESDLSEVVIEESGDREARRKKPSLEAQEKIDKLVLGARLVQIQCLVKMGRGGEEDDATVAAARGLDILDLLRAVQRRAKSTNPCQIVSVGAKNAIPLLWSIKSTEARLTALRLSAEFLDGVLDERPGAWLGFLQQFFLSNLMPLLEQRVAARREEAVQVFLASLERARRHPDVPPEPLASLGFEFGRVCYTKFGDGDDDEAEARRTALHLMCSSASTPSQWLVAGRTLIQHPAPEPPSPSSCFLKGIQRWAAEDCSYLIESDTVSAALACVDAYWRIVRTGPPALSSSVRDVLSDEGFARLLRLEVQACMRYAVATNANSVGSDVRLALREAIFEPVLSCVKSEDAAQRALKTWSTWMRVEANMSLGGETNSLASSHDLEERIQTVRASLRSEHDDAQSSGEEEFLAWHAFLWDSNVMKEAGDETIKRAGERLLRVLERRARGTLDPNAAKTDAMDAAAFAEFYGLDELAISFLAVATPLLKRFPDAGLTVRCARAAERIGSGLGLFRETTEQRGEIRAKIMERVRLASVSRYRTWEGGPVCALETLHATALLGDRFANCEGEVRAAKYYYTRGRDMCTLRSMGVVQNAMRTRFERRLRRLEWESEGEASRRRDEEQPTREMMTLERVERAEEVFSEETSSSTSNRRVGTAARLRFDEAEDAARGSSSPTSARLAETIVSLIDDLPRTLEKWSDALRPLGFDATPCDALSLRLDHLRARSESEDFTRLTPRLEAHLLTTPSVRTGHRHALNMASDIALEFLNTGRWGEASRFARRARLGETREEGESIVGLQARTALRAVIRALVPEGGERDTGMRTSPRLGAASHDPVDAFLIHGGIGGRARMVPPLEGSHLPLDLQWWRAKGGLVEAAAAQRASVASSLPPSWVVVGVSALEGEGGALLISRVSRDVDTTCIVRPRGGVSASSLLHDFRELVARSEAMTRGDGSGGSSVNSWDKKRWWNERHAMDEAMESILSRAEREWFGGWRRALVCGARIGPQEVWVEALIQELREVEGVNDEELLRLILEAPALESVGEYLEAFRACGGLRDDDDDDVEEEESNRRDQCSTEARLRTLAERAFEEAQRGRGESFQAVRGPVMLALGGGIHDFPFESLPCLAHGSVSRVISLSHALWQLREAGVRNGDVNHYPLITISTGAYVVDPKSDLPRTRETMGELVRAIEKQCEGWSGWVGVAPPGLPLALSSNDAFFYCGHGGGEEFASRDVLGGMRDRLPRVVLLLGCSSAKRRDAGQFEPSGLVDVYAGAPRCSITLGNLWDVTDKDIDRFTSALFMGSEAENEEEEEKASFEGLLSGRAVDFLALVSKCRSACKLKRLIGAAPVVWGIPVLVQLRTKESRPSEPPVEPTRRSRDDTRTVASKQDAAVTRRKKR